MNREYAIPRINVGLNKRIHTEVILFFFFYVPAARAFFFHKYQHFSVLCLVW